MNLTDLLKKRNIRRVESDKKQSEECLKGAERDLKLAKKMIKEDFDWTMALAYNAMHQAARSLMFYDGYHAVGGEKHKTAVAYADVKIGAKYGELIDLFDDMRKKRHQVVYETVGAISEYEAKYALKIAGEFVEKIKEKMRK